MPVCLINLGDGDAVALDHRGTAGMLLLIRMVQEGHPGDAPLAWESKSLRSNTTKTVLNHLN